MRRKMMFSIAFAVILLGGCAAAPPRDAGAPAAAAEPAREAALMALGLVGTPYAARGNSPNTGFDCSGLVAYVYARALQLRLPRNTFDLSRVGAPVRATDLQPGDLVFYNTQGRPFSHVGIYLGEMRFVHAPSSGGAVRTENMRLGYWARRYDGARRVAL
jgi:cell wall-associated NlpC family hydrolase